MPAEIIAIGTELLLGEIVDTNTAHIARKLRDIGLDLYWASTVGDNQERIADAVARAVERSQIVITTGGLGPTVDDPTRESVAQALGRPLEFREALWAQVQARFARWGRAPTENNRRQAHVPAGATAIENPVGTAPAFIAETQECAVICLPGVPKEMEYLLDYAVLPYIRKRLLLSGLIKARVLHTSGWGESQLDEKIADLELLSNPTVGLAAHTGVVDIRITAKAQTESEADEMIWGIEATLRQRLGDLIFGADEQTLAGVAMDDVAKRGWKVAVVEAGTGGALMAAAAPFPEGFAGGQAFGEDWFDRLEEATEEARVARGAQLGLGLAVRRLGNGSELGMALLGEGRKVRIVRGYGGPPGSAATWATNLALNLLRLQMRS